MHALFLDNHAALAQSLDRWRSRPWLAVDTEFVRVDTYFARLCLIQVSDGQEHACIDTLALPELTPLLDRLNDASILKLFHAPGQDLEIFAQLDGRCPAPLFDTQVAATLLGLGDQIGYAGLVDKMLGITLDKSLARTDWARRPLSARELAYAAADVAHLAEIYPTLRERLVERGRLAWLEEDCARMADPALYRADPERAWERLRGLGRLPPAAQRVAARLAQWREEQARARNRPRKWILEDEPVYRLAERQPRDRAELSALQALPPKVFDRHADALLSAIAAGLADPAEPLAREEEYDAAQKARLQALQARLRELAAALGLPPAFLAPRADLAALLERGAQADIVLLKGWRREVAGAELLSLL